jgi:hypothetical protein
MTMTSTFEDISDYKAWLKANPTERPYRAVQTGAWPELYALHKPGSWNSGYWEHVKTGAQRVRLSVFPAGISLAPLTVKGERYWVPVDTEYAVVKCRERYCDYPIAEDGEELCKTHGGRARREAEKYEEQNREREARQRRADAREAVIKRLTEETGVRASTAYSFAYGSAQGSRPIGIAVSETFVNDFIAMYMMLQDCGIEVDGMSTALASRMHGGTVQS